MPDFVGGDYYSDITLKVNGQPVSNIKPSTNCQLYADIAALYWGFHLEFLVIRLSDNQEVLRQYVALNPIGQAWLDWVSPSQQGNYRFYPDSADPSYYYDFTVSSSGSGGGGGGGSFLGLTTTQLLIIGGLVVGFVILTRKK